MFSETSSSGSARSLEHAAEQQPLLQDGRNRRTVDDGLSGSGLRPKAAEHIALKVVAVMYAWFSTGISVASIGIEAYYDIKDAAAAVIFPVAVSGYLIGTSLVHTAHVNLGWRGVSILVGIFHVAGGVVLSTKPPSYAGILAAYFLVGIGTGFGDSSFCTWAAGLCEADKISGLIHGSYALGCVTGPIIVAALVKAELGWQSFYMVLLVAFAVEAGAILIAFRHENAAKHWASTCPKESSDSGFSGSWKPILMCSLYCFVYVGTEASMSGWLTSYMIRNRHMSPSIAALATSLYWVGMVLGRFSLGPLARLVGLRLTVIVFVCTSIGLQVLFRLQASLPLSLCLALGIGFVAGPIFPSGILTMTRRLPKSIHVRAVALTCAIGQLGGAGAPFVIGVVAQTSGIERLFDVVLGLSLTLLLVWLWFSRPQPIDCIGE
ncbi:hypothetical protein LTR99_007032 [Exophiala xenobiotica]|uniref:Major facilitator superfamily (MFS) profile domain-containing protein n=1 Tax=Vermiconidia calcicola TaxID=1690605 RepID=A0AAV9PT85_9PEZI|nr:hypothetical protein LTR92_006850 [Exophiala xenobiotica]KAK5528826.1 hypothetical protein LTR25_010009 [Vermiconidia calcicola]KAK5539444.1 hypothetical protein LTR23_006464 [Chaetothyriales sp. CCFEE 6169]KAK5269598.1 hypothetical protein LTR96_005294 [Exophiala xenobiotica]KAK5300285.1 hypothetical protein LTR99_007032 [Exophiala xenobiotica]